MTDEQENKEPVQTNVLKPAKAIKPLDSFVQAGRHIVVSYPITWLIQRMIKVAMSGPEVALTSSPPAHSSLAQIPDFGQPKPFDNQNSIRSLDGDY